MTMDWNEILQKPPKKEQKHVLVKSSNSLFSCSDNLIHVNLNLDVQIPASTVIYSLNHSNNLSKNLLKIQKEDGIDSVIVANINNPSAAIQAQLRIKALETNSTLLITQNTDGTIQDYLSNGCSLNLDPNNLAIPKDWDSMDKIDLLNQYKETEPPINLPKSKIIQPLDSQTFLASLISSPNTAEPPKAIKSENDEKIQKLLKKSEDIRNKYLDSSSSANHPKNLDSFFKSLLVPKK